MGDPTGSCGVGVQDSVVERRDGHLGLTLRSDSRFGSGEGGGSQPVLTVPLEGLAGRGGWQRRSVVGCLVGGWFDGTGTLSSFWSNLLKG